MTTFKIRKLSISQSGSIFGISRSRYTIPENFMKIRPGVLEKSSKIKNNNNSKEKETEE